MSLFSLRVIVRFCVLEKVHRHIDSLVMRGGVLRVPLDTGFDVVLVVSARRVGGSFELLRLHLGGPHGEAAEEEDAEGGRADHADRYHDLARVRSRLCFLVVLELVVAETELLAEQEETDNDDD